MVNLVVIQLWNYDEKILELTGFEPGTTNLQSTTLPNELQSNSY